MVKQYRQNRIFQNNERKFYQQLAGDDTKTYQQPDAKETEPFWTEIWQPKNITKKPNGWTTWQKNNKGSEKAWKWKYKSIYSKWH